MGDEEERAQMPVVALIVHDPERCAGRPCCYHAPSEHHMRTWPLHTRLDAPIYREDETGRLRVDYLTERVCVHRVGHPDPDAVAYLDAILGPDHGYDVHGCDGCCVPLPPNG